ncbi:MAG: DUF4214 domain-containing protein [Desulfobacteraceae bacterium]|nr:DUF4214 domain-containing protein [Desulfobacteraceae bacterium]
MALTQTQVSQLYVSVFGRASEGAGNTYWQTNQADMTTTADVMLATDAAKDYFGATLNDNAAFIAQIYENTLGKTDDTVGMAYWVEELEAGKSKGEVIVALIDAALADNNAGDAQDQFKNKVDVSDYTATNINTVTTTDAFKAFIDGVDHTADSVAEGKGEVDAAKTASTGEKHYLTANQDKGTEFEGNAGDDMFYADVVQYGGPQVNSLATGDVLDGKGGNDTLEAQVTEGLYMGDTNMAIQPRTSSIETVKLEALEANMGSGENSEVYVNAKNMLGVDKLASWHSDANLTIQNLTTQDESGTARNLSEMTIGMEYSGNNDSHWDESDFKVYFDQDYLNPRQVFSNKYVSYELMNEDAYDVDSSRPLDGVIIERLDFTLNGTVYKLAPYIEEDVAGLGDEVVDYNDLLAAVSTAVDALKAANPKDAELQKLEVQLGKNFTSDNGRVGRAIDFVIPGSQDDGSLNVLSVFEQQAQLDPAEGANAVANSNRWESASETTPDNTQELRINVDLEKVGLAGDGGELVIGSMNKGESDDNSYNADRSGSGIDTFDVTVYGNDGKPTSLSGLRSTNNTLKEVNVKTDDAQTGTYADLTIGNSHSAETGFGLKDVQTFDASGFKGNLTLGAKLTDDVVAKYMNLVDDQENQADDNISFNYTLGEGNDNLNLEITDANEAAAGTTTREDFDLKIDGGSGNDTITFKINDSTANVNDNWYANHVDNANIEIKGGAGNDTINTPGAGTVKIDAGSGDDTVYSDNTGEIKAQWVVNAANSDIADLDGLDGLGAVAPRMLQGAKLTVTFAAANQVNEAGMTQPDAVEDVVGYESEEVIISVDATGTQAEVNQAIKAAINDDLVLNKLLVATDGPEDTIVITSKIDGAFDTDDLSFNIQEITLADLTTAEQDQLKNDYKVLMNDSTAVLDQKVLEDAADFFADKANIAELVANGSSSAFDSDNIINAGNGQDVVVMGTGETSQETLVFENFGLGKVTVVNFDDDDNSTSEDTLDFSSYLTSRFSSSGSDVSESVIVATPDITVVGTGTTEDANANEVIVLNDFQEDKAAGETWDNLTEDNFLEAIKNETGTDNAYGNIGDTSSDVVYYGDTLVDSTQYNVFMVENDQNQGEYKVFQVTSTIGANGAGEFSDAKLITKLDLGASFDQNDDANVAPTVAASLPTTASAMIGTATTLDVLSHITDDDGDALEISAVSTSAGGTAVVNDNGTPADTTDDLISYTSAAGFTGQEVLTFTVNDGHGHSVTRDVTFNVSATTENAVDMANGGSYTATDGVVDVFTYQLDSTSGRAVQADGTVTIEGFNVAEDRLVFDDVEGGTMTAANFVTFAGVSIAENPFADNTIIAFDPNTEGESGIITLSGIQDADLSTVDFSIA